MLTCVTDTLIEELTDANCDDLRSRHVFRQALRGLVRVAKAEQLREMRADVALAIGAISQPADCDSDSRAPT